MARLLTQVCLFFLCTVPRVAFSEPAALSSALRQACGHWPAYVAGEALEVPERVEAYYCARAGAPRWWNGRAEIVPAARALLEEIEGAGRHGLSPLRYHARALELLLNGAPDSGSCFAVEVLFTDAFFALADHLFAGALRPQEVSPDWALRPARLAASAIEKRLAPDIGARQLHAELAALLPPTESYRELEGALRRYIQWEKKGPFTAIGPGPSLRPGAVHPRVGRLQRRLVEEGYLTDGSFSPGLYDSATERAVGAFQATHGLIPDGLVGWTTILELDQPVSERVAQIAINLERARWLPRELGHRHLFVDIADFSLALIEDGKPVLLRRIIVGADQRETPVFRAELKSIVLNPPWTIPASIVAEEILPQLPSRAGRLRRRGIRVYRYQGKARTEIDPATIDWSEVADPALGFLFEQDPGPRNPLGAIKFQLPNPFSVYLHGTSDPDLFERRDRSLSHGCIRVEDPLELAARVLEGAAIPWTVAELNRVIAQGTTFSVPLPAPIPVYLWYRTAWIDGHGRLQFRHDIYGWDELLRRAMREKSHLLN